MIKNWDEEAEQDLLRDCDLFLVSYTDGTNIEVRKRGHVPGDYFSELEQRAEAGSKIAIKARDLILRSRFVAKITDETPSVTAVGYGLGQYVAVTTDKAVWASIDGTNWTKER